MVVLNYSEAVFLFVLGQAPKILIQKRIYFPTHSKLISLEEPFNNLQTTLYIIYTIDI